MNLRKRLISISLILSMVITGLGITTVFAGDPDAPVLMRPYLELSTLQGEYWLIKEHVSYYVNGKEAHYSDTQNEYTFYSNGRIKTNKSTTTSSGGSYTSIFETEYDDTGKVLKQTNTEIENGKTTVTDMGAYDGDTAIPSGQEPTFTTDSEGRLISVKGDGWEFKMVYDADGNRTSETHYENGKLVETVTWTYDAQGREATETVSSEAGTRKYIYSYDTNNRLSGFDYTSGSNKYHASYKYAESGDYLTVTAELFNTTSGNQVLEEKSVREYKLFDFLPFTDVVRNSYYYDAVKWATQAGITNGTSATTFSPNEGCTRAQMVTFLWRANGSPEPKSSKNPFTDIKAGTFYYKAVLWAYEEGITTGTTATTFSPEKTCTRAEAVTFLWRSAGKPATSSTSSPFTDIKAGTFYYKAVLWASATGVTKGTTTTTFSPNDNCVRAQIVTFLYRLLNK